MTPQAEYLRLYRTRYDISPETVSLSLMKTGNRVLQKNGVNCFKRGWYYWCDEMSQYKDAKDPVKVETRYTDRDYSRIRVVLPDKKAYEASLIKGSSLLNPNKETLQTVAKARALAEEFGVELGKPALNLPQLEIELARKLRSSPRPIFVDQANYLGERSLGTICFLWEKRHLPIVLVGAKTLFENFYRSKLTEDVRGPLTSRIALHYLLPELTRPETKAVLHHALSTEVTDEMIGQIHEVTGGNFRGVDMIIPRILELKHRNQQKLADGTVTMKEIISVAAARLMI